MDKKILVVFCAGMMFEKNVREILENKTIGAQRFREYAKSTVTDWITFSQLQDWMSTNYFLDRN